MTDFLRTGNQTACRLRIVFGVALVAAFLCGANRTLARATGDDTPPSPTLERSVPEPDPASEPSSLFLVATRQVQGPFFAESVVLLIHHNQGGAMGLILNRPSAMQIADLLPALGKKTAPDDALYVGGPVDPSQMIFLLRRENPPAGALPILSDVYATSDASVLQEFVKGRLSKTHFHAYVGYAGWGPGQLDAEIARGDWLIGPAEAKTIFDSNVKNIWQRLLAELEGVQVRIYEESVSRLQAG